MWLSSSTKFPSSTLIRSNEIKEPFSFHAFEDNNMTLFVQPKDPNSPMNGCLSFWRKLEHIRSDFELLISQHVTYQPLFTFNLIEKEIFNKLCLFLCFSATQQVPLCEVKFDVSNGDTSFVIGDQMSWTQVKMNKLIFF